MPTYTRLTTVDSPDLDATSSKSNRTSQTQIKGLAEKAGVFGASRSLSLVQGELQPAHAPFGGELLKMERLRYRMSIEEVSRITRIPVKTLMLLEANRFEELPGDVFVRGFVKSYARALKMDANVVLESLQPLAEEPKVFFPLRAGEKSGGGRFGLALAIAILLILFTLSLAIVLRPRQRADVELSDASQMTVISDQTYA